MIALGGMVIWYLASPRQAWRTALFAIVYLLVALTGSSVVPDAIKSVLPDQLRFSIPLTALWLAMLGQLAFTRNQRAAAVEGG